jgi:uncharacterized membrane protein
MEIIVILFLIVILVILINQGSNLGQRFARLEAEIQSLRQQLHKQRMEANQQAERPKERPAAPAAMGQQTAAITPAPETPPAIAPLPINRPTPAVPPAQPQAVEPPPPISEPVTVTVEQTIVPPTAQPAAAQPAPARKLEKQDSDLEKFIGENLISKIGIGILVIAIGFFVKYAIDNNWVGEVGRVAIGILCGGILIALAHRMRNTYRAFSSVLAGGGLAVFYFTITLAYKQFHLFGQPAAFGIKIGITAFAAALSLLYNKQELAITALVGGFAAPLLVSSGNNNYITLFSYLAILNTGILVISYYKGWRLLNLLAFIFTVLFFGTWLLYATLSNEPYSPKYAFIFATIFYLLFFAINIAHNIKEKKKFIASDFGILLANTCLYFSAGLYCFSEMGLANYRGLFSAAMGLFNLIASYFFFRKQKIDTNILYLLIGITLSFISLTAPLQLHGNHITLFWATETVLLYWLFTKSKIRLVELSSVIVWAAMLVSLLWDWANIYGNVYGQLAIMANKGFITTLFAAIATYMLFVIRLKTDDQLKAGPVTPGKTSFRIIAIFLAYMAGALELHHQFNYYYPQTPLYLQYLLLYTALFALVGTWVMQKARASQTAQFVPPLLLAVAVLFYLLFITPTYYTQEFVLVSPGLSGQFTVHWLAAAAVAGCLVRLVLLLKKWQAAQKEALTWLCCTAIAVFISVELHLVANALFYGANNPLDEIQRVYIKTGLPIIWGLCSFAFMWLGMRFKYRPLRIISLTLFTITLAKLFIFDIRNIPAAGKIAAFFCLGVLLLVVSFMYQRLKKIIIEDEKNNQ